MNMVADCHSASMGMITYMISQEGQTGCTAKTAPVLPNKSETTAKEVELSNEGQLNGKRLCI